MEMSILIIFPFKYKLLIHNEQRLMFWCLTDEIWCTVIGKSLGYEVKKKKICVSKFGPNLYKST